MMFAILSLRKFTSDVKISDDDDASIDSPGINLPAVIKSIRRQRAAFTSL